MILHIRYTTDSMTWWTEAQHDAMAAKLSPGELEYVLGMSPDNIITILRTSAAAAIVTTSPLEAKIQAQISAIQTTIQSDLQSIRHGVLTDVVNVLGNPVAGGMAQIQALVGGVDRTIHTVLEHTQRLPEAIELHKTRPKTSARVGQIGESAVADILKAKYQDVEMTTGKTASGDIRVNKKLMVEIKTYKNPVPLKEYDKFVRDIIFSKEVTCALFVTSTNISSPDYRTPLHYMVKRIDSNRIVPVAIITGIDEQLILSTCELLLTHSEVLENISSASEVNKTAKSELAQLIFDATADLRDIVSSRESLHELSAVNSRTIQKISADLCELERKFHLKLIHMRNKLNDICSDEGRNIISSPDTDDETLTTMLSGCRKYKVEAYKILKEAFRRAAAFNPPPIGPIGYTNKYVSLGTFTVHFTATCTSFRVPVVSMSRAQKYELMEMFASRDYNVTSEHIEIVVDESSADDIIRYCFRYCGL